MALHQPRLFPRGEELAASVDALSRFCASVRVVRLPSERSPLHRVIAAARSVASREPFDVCWLRSREMCEVVNAWAAAGTIELVHVDTVGLWPYVAHWSGSPIALGHHNIESALTERRSAHESAPWRRALLRRDAAKPHRTEFGAAARAAVNIVVSDLDAERLAAISPPARIAVVENGVDTEYFRSSGSAGTGLVFAGTLDWFPNRDAVEFLLSEIWPALLRGRADRHLVLVGKNPPPRAIAARHANVQVTSFVPDVRPYLQEASIYICPLRVGGGTRVKVLDALSMGKPLVSTAIGVEGLDLVAGEHYLPAETPAEFVRQVERLEDSPELRQLLGSAGRRLVQARYDWRAIGGQLDRAYASASMNPSVEASA